MDAITGLTIIIGILTCYIAYRQMYSDALRFKFELYHKRLEIYNNVQAFIEKINQDAEIEKSDLFKFRNSLAEAEFLFKKNRNLLNRLDLIDKKAIELITIKNDDTELLLWFSDQNKELIKLFGEYLDVSKI